MPQFPLPLVRAALRPMYRLALNPRLSYPVRQRLLELAAPIQTLPPGTVVQHTTLAGRPAERITVGATERRTAVLYLHGGAYTCGSPATHRSLAAHLAAATESAVYVLDYRLAPANPYPAALEDAVAAYLELITERGVDAARTPIAGDSAGGFLTFAVAHEAVRLGIGRPAGTVALSPLTDLDPRGKLDHPNSHRCAVFPRRAVAVLPTLVERAERLGGEGAEPVASPVDLDLSEMPPALIQTGSEEMTYVDAELMARRLQLAGVSAELQVWEKQVHAFQAAAGVVPESSRAIAEIGRFVRELR